MEELFAAGLSEDMAITQLRAIIHPLQSWARQHFPTSKLDKGPSIDFGGGNKRDISIDRILATEEKIWSPMWGLKGQIDIMINANVSQSHSNMKILTPLELKTGYKIKDEHHAQVSLYSLLVNDRYKGLSVVGSSDGLPFASGLLLHINSRPSKKAENVTKASTLGVRHSHREIQSLIAIRNQFAAASAPKWMRSNEEKKSDEDIPSLPPVVGNRYGECNRCYQKEACMLYHRSIENGNSKSSGMREELYERSVGYLKKAHLQYFRKWIHLLDLELNSTVSHQREIWNLSSSDREKLGRCLSNMRLVESKAVTTDDLSGAKTYVHTFERHTSATHELHNRYSQHRFDPNAYVAVSIEDAHHVIMSGRIESLCTDQILIRSQHALRLPRNTSLKHIRWRIDVDEMYTSFRMIKNNLVQLFIGTTNNGDADESRMAGDERTRELVVDLVEPKFNPTVSPQIDTVLFRNSSLKRRFEVSHCFGTAAFSSLFI